MRVARILVSTIFACVAIAFAFAHMSSAASVVAVLSQHLPPTVIDTLPGDFLNNVIYEIATGDSPERALSFIDEVVDEHTDTSEATIHALTHTVGHALEETRGLGGLTICGKEKVGISMGCYHGVMERFFDDEIDIETVDFRTFTDVCGVDKHSLDCFDIYHGLGHGFLLYFMLERDEAKEMCTRFDDPLHVAHCLKGVAMQWVEAVPFEKLEAARENPWKLCEGDASWSDACATILVPRLFAYLATGRRTLDLDLYAVANDIGAGCATATAALRAACFRGIGIMAAIRADRRPAADICTRAGGDANAHECLRALARRAHDLGEPEVAVQGEMACARLADDDTCPY